MNNDDREPNEIRKIMLRYFYDRNVNATSARGKNGSSVKISTLKAELKGDQGLSQKQVQCHLTYLTSQGWVEEQEVQKQFKAKSGSFIPSTTSFYQITAAGIDKIEGEGEFTMPKFSGINIEATGQNIITLGDGNKIAAEHSGLGKALVDLRDAIVNSQVTEVQKMDYVADIDTIQSQLAKPKPNMGIVQAAWLSVKNATALNGCASLVSKVAAFIGGLLAS